MAQSELSYVSRQTPQGTQIDASVARPTGSDLARISGNGKVTVNLVNAIGFGPKDPLTARDRLYAMNP